jgi:hypothetical protein
MWPGSPRWAGRRPPRPEPSPGRGSPHVRPRTRPFRALLGSNDVPATDRPAASAPAGRRRSLEIALWVVVMGLVVWRFGPQVGAAFGIAPGPSPPPTSWWRPWRGDGPAVRPEGPGRPRQLLGDLVPALPHGDARIPAGLGGLRRPRLRHCRPLRGPGRPQRCGPVGGDRGLTFPIAFAPGSVVRTYGGANVLPTSILIDTGGPHRASCPGLLRRARPPGRGPETSALSANAWHEW